MVVRLLKYGFSLIASLLAALLLTVLWLVWSPSGSSWLLTTLCSLSPVEIAVDRVTGRLADQLQLEGVRVRWPQGAAEVQLMRLDWSFLHLLRGELQVEELSVAGMDLLLDPPSESASPSVPDSAEPFVFVWPQLSGWPLQVLANILSLQVDDLVVRSPVETLWQLSHLRGRLGWESGTFTLAELDLVAREGTLAGQLSADLVAARLYGEMQASLTEGIIADVDRARLTFDLNAANDRSVLTGTLESLLYSGPKAWFDVAATVELAGSSLQVSEGTILFPGHSDRLQVQGLLHLKDELPWQATVLVDQLDLTELAGVPLLLSGKIQGAGDMDEYRGLAALENSVDGWLQSRLTGSFDGNLDGIGLTGLAGDWLGGSFTGDLTIGWLDGLTLRSAASGRDLDLTKLSTDWPGRLNLDLSAALLQSGEAPLTMRFSAALHDSTLHGKPLAGGAAIQIQGDEVEVGRLALHGSGLNLTAAGRLSERLDISVSTDQLSGLVPGLNGRMELQGWLNLVAHELSGQLGLQGRELDYGDFSLRDLALSAEKAQGEERFVLKAAGKNGSAAGQQIDALSVAMDGTVEAHEGTLGLLSPLGEGRMQLSGGYQAGGWFGILTELILTQTLVGDWKLDQETPVQIDPERLHLAPLQLVSPLGERIELDALLNLSPLNGVAQFRWDRLQLSHADPWLQDWRARGSTSGDVQLHLLDGDQLDLSAVAKMAGGMSRGEHQFDLADCQIALDWNRRGLDGQAHADFGDLGRLTATLHSSEPARQAFPATGDFSVRVEDLSMSRLYPLGPASLDVEGILSGTTEGRWENAADITLQGQADISGGRLSWQEEDGSLEALLQQATLDWAWRGDRLSGHTLLVLADHGRLQGEFNLPISTRWPFVINPAGSVQGALSGYLQEKGLLTALFPGSVRESHGQLDFDGTLGGLWERPSLGGVFSLVGASAYLPAAGVQLKDVGFKGRLSADRIFLDTFSVVSGDGRLEGSGEVQLADWLLKAYQCRLTGKDLQLVNLPELQLTVSPELQLSGDPQQLQLRGSVTIPQALLAARNEPAPVQSSPDVIIVDAAAPPSAKALPVALDAQVRILLGDRVLVKANGIDAKLGGEVALQAKSLDDVTAKGKIQVVEGSYAAYGLGLNIERGNVFFAGGPVDRPALDILALRKAGEVKAGVQVTGTPRQPLVKLYSEPLLPDTDILSYIVLGRPLGSDSGQSDLLMTAAGALLSKGESAVLQDRLKRRLGLDVLEVQAGNGDVASSMVTIGKYLSPKLYVSLGHALFTNSNEFRLRYKLGESWDLESNVGLESGTDLYYRIGFD